MKPYRKVLRSSKGAIVGCVTTKQGEPVIDANVMITGNSPIHKDIAAVTNNIGEYRFDDLLAGDYTILVNAEGYAIQTLDAHVEASKITVLNFLLSDT
jgi:hypothetical protein